MDSGNRMFSSRFRWSEIGRINAFWRGLILLAAFMGAGIAPWHGAQADTYKLLHSFCAKSDCADGQSPVAGLIRDGSGNLYGTTYGGGIGRAGTVFELMLNATTGKFTEKVLHAFCAKTNTNCSDGTVPSAGLIRDGSGNLYGTTLGGGPYGGGTVFELVLNATTGKYTETVLHSFCVKTNCADGEYPEAGLFRDGSGNLYGTTAGGGAHGWGTVFELVK